MLAVTELCERLGLIAALDEGMGPVKQRRRGFTGGQVLAGMAAAQLAGEDFLLGLDRVRADQAGQLVTPVPGLATSTATGIARRVTQALARRGSRAGHGHGGDDRPAAAERAAELAEGPVTIDIDATDVEVYGSRKRGVAYNYQGQRAGRPHVASWAETEIPLAADLLAGDDPRSPVVGLLGRALAALPQAVRDGAAAAGQKIALRADAGYFAGDLARAAAKEDMAFAIGAKRITSMWKALAGIAEDAWRDAIDMQTRRSRSRRTSRRTGPTTRCCWSAGSSWTPNRSPPTPAPGAAAPCTRTSGPCRSRNWSKNPLSTPAVSSAPTWTCPPRPRRPRWSTGTGTAPASRTSSVTASTAPRCGTCRRRPTDQHRWMWASLIAAAIAAWLHQLTGLISGGELVEGHGVRGGKAMIATLRRVLIAVPARLVRHGGQLIMRLAPGADLLPAVLATIRALPAPG